MCLYSISFSFLFIPLFVLILSITKLTFQIIHEQSSGLSPVFCFFTLCCSSQSCLLPFHRPFATKKRAPRKGEALFLLSAFTVFKRALPAFGRANAPTIQLHSVTLRRLRSTAFQPYDVCRPPCFQRLLL